MKLSGLILASALIASPAMAAGANDQGIIRTSGQVASTCSVDDLNITLTQQGTNQMKGQGFLPIEQTGTTKWTIGNTKAIEGSGFTSEVQLRGYSNLTMRSTQSRGESKTVNGKQAGRALVDITLTAQSGFGPGRVQTETTVQCVVQ